MLLTLWPLRLLLTLHLAAVLAQPVLAGRYLTGDIDAIAAHGMVGNLLAVSGLLLVVLTLLYAIAGRGRLWVVPAGVVLFLAIGVQAWVGYTRDLALHVPLGVAVVAASVLLAVWAWSPSAGRSR